MINRTDNTWNGVSIEVLFKEFEEFNQGNGLGPAINYLIDNGHTTNKGRAPFHIRTLRDRFYHELATDYVARIKESKPVLSVACS